MYFNMNFSLSIHGIYEHAAHDWDSFKLLFRSVFVDELLDWFQPDVVAANTAAGTAIKVKNSFDVPRINAENYCLQSNSEIQTEIRLYCAQLIDIDVQWIKTH